MKGAFHLKVCKSAFSILIAFVLGISSCSKLNELNKPEPGLGAAKLYAGTWTPSISNSGSLFNKGSVTTTRRSYSVPSSKMVRMQDPWDASKETTVSLGTFNSLTDFGYSSTEGNGSITLTADALNYPITGGAFPILTSLYVMSGGVKIAEFVNLNIGCQSGMFACAGGVCERRSECGVSSPSAFLNGDDWLQHNTPPYGYTSVNSFPRCDSGVNSWSWCPTNLNKLPSGDYYAKYLLVSDSGLSVSNKTATLNVEMSVRKDVKSRNDPSTPSNGTLNLNVILVGKQNIDDSHKPKGAQNLNLLFEEVNQILKNGAKIVLGTVKVYEWRDEDGGSQYSQIYYYDLGKLFASGSLGIPQEDNGKAVNVFMVRDIQADPSVSYSILGISGGIMGPPVNGKYSSGLAFSTAHGVNGTGLISDYNTGCTLSSCTRDQQDDDFLEMGATIAHEIGHYLALNHPSEKVSTLSENQQVDQMPDTPTCKPRGTLNSPILDQQACYLDTTLQFGGTKDCATACDDTIPGIGKYYLGGSKTNNFCPTVSECQFNHLMWYTTKIRYKVSGVWREDGNLLSPQSSALIQWNPFLQ